MRNDMIRLPSLPGGSAAHMARSARLCLDDLPLILAEDYSTHRIRRLGGLGADGTNTPFGHHGAEV